MSMQSLSEATQNLITFLAIVSRTILQDLRCSSCGQTNSGNASSAQVSRELGIPERCHVALILDFCFIRLAITPTIIVLSISPGEQDI